MLTYIMSNLHYIFECLGQLDTLILLDLTHFKRHIQLETSFILFDVGTRTREKN